MARPSPPGFDANTLSTPLQSAEQHGVSMVALTLLWHPELARAGQRVVITAVDEPLLLSRHEPVFRHADQAGGQPLAHPSVSRSPIRLTAEPGGAVRLEVKEGRMRCEVDGQSIGPGSLSLDAAAVDRGVVLQLGGRVALCLHRVSTLPQGAEPWGLVGVSDAMARVRRQVAQVGPTEWPVLILGESGTGKELVAQAVHAASRRHKGPMVALNMAAMSEALAAADLFGAARGAYTGAQVARKGLIAEAEGGTLFLDEIGDAALPVQPMLLRVIETGEYRPLGSTQTARADVRLIAATDRDLSKCGFNQPLLRRLEAFVIHTPALRDRREDIGVLVAHMLGSLLGNGPWPTDVPSELVRAMCLYDWPGNVRQLGHAVRRLALAWQAGQWPTVQELLGAATGSFQPPVGVHHRPDQATGDPAPAMPPSVPPSVARPAARYRPPGEISPSELREALDAAGWQLQDAARALRVSRPSLYNLLDRHGVGRRVESIPQEEIESALAELGTGDLAALAARLCTPRDALRRHLRGAGYA